MAATEERLASLEARMDRIDDLIALVRELRTDMNRRFDAVDRRFEAMDRKFEGKLDAVDTKFDGKFDRVSREMHLNFQWIVGIQLTILAAIVAALIEVVSR
jgi:hypothetical protein